MALTEPGGESAPAWSRAAEQQSAQEGDGSTGVDLDALADEVFALLKKELRIERERSGRRRPD